MTQELFSSTTTPLTPPKLEEDRLSWLRLFRSQGVGVHTFFRLMQDHGDAQRVLDMLPDLAARAGLRHYEACPVAMVEAEWRAARKAHAHLVCYGDPQYPALLADIEDPPPVFWAKGNLDLLMRPAVAIVGARNASSLGERMARRLAQDLGAAGFSIVSGLARGIDTAAHDASLRTGTIAVQGGGIDVAYPKENQKLFDRIGQVGLLVAEQPMGLSPQSRHFPRRNRIITGLSAGVVVVEAAARSGSLISARNAADQGREVMAVPGHPMDGRASGCNMLLRDGATLIRSADDVIEALAGLAEPELPLEPVEIAQPGETYFTPAPPCAAPAPKPAATRSAVSPQPASERSAYQEILNRLGPVPLAEDQLIRDLKLPATAIAPVLLDLEMAGKITRHAGGLLSRL